MLGQNTGSIPKIGDRVSIIQQDGVFEVADINSLLQAVTLKSTDGKGRITRNVPWSVLRFLGKKHLWEK